MSANQNGSKESEVTSWESKVEVPQKERGRWERAKKWASESRLRRIALAAGIISILCLVVLELLLPVGTGTVGSLLERLAEAVLIAAFISLVLDGPAKSEIAAAASADAAGEWRRLSEQGLWALLNDKAWPEHRQLIVSMAERRTFLGRLDWRITFYDDPELSELLRLDVEVDSHGQTFDPGGTFPTGESSLLASSDGRESRHTHYFLQRIRAKRQVTMIDADDAVLNDPANELVGPNKDGAVMLDLERIRVNHSKAGIEIGEGDDFHERRSAVVYRHKRGFFPMWSVSTACDVVVTVKNESSANLLFRVARLDELNVPDLVPGEEQSLGTFPPGCACILSWAEVGEGEKRGAGDTGEEAGSSLSA